MARSRKPNAARHHREKARRSAVTYASPCPMPPANRKWHPRARRWYEGLSKSPQAVHYQRSDWDLAWAAATNLSDWYEMPPVERIARNPTTFMQAQRLLMTTHINRLNGKMEVVPDAPPGESVESAPDNVVPLQERFG